MSALSWSKVGDLSWYPPNVLLIYVGVGQSYARGATADVGTVISTTPVYPNLALMVANGPLVTRRTNLDLVSARETPTPKTQETFGSGFVNNLISKVQSTFGISQKVAFLLSAENSQPLTRLNRGSLRYNLALDGIRDAKEHALRHGLIPIVAGALCEQGQADDWVHRATYAAGLQRWSMDFAADARAITGQSDDPLFYVMQVAAGNRRDPWDASFFEQGAALAQLDLHGHGLIRLVGPDYQFPISADLRHPTSVGYYRLGALFAEAVFAQTSGQGWHPILCRRAFKIGTNRIRLDMAVPDKGDLMIDLAGDIVPTEAACCGFLVMAEGAACPVTAVSIPASPDLANINRRWVDLDVETPSGAGAKVYFAQRADGTGGLGPVFGPRGNLRTVATYQPLLGPPRPHWCPAFTVEVPG